MWPAAHGHGANRAAELRHAARHSRESNEGKAAQRQQHGDDDLIFTTITTREISTAHFDQLCWGTNATASRIGLIRHCGGAECHR